MGGLINVERLEEWDDVFDDQVVKRSTNESNLAGHYEYSPERWRLFKGSATSGNRLFPEYDSVPEYNHAGDYHELKPAGGETIIFESSERYRYVVQYELEASWAWAINQDLNPGDRVRCGLYTGDDGWFLEHNGDHSDDEVDLVMLRNGSEQYRTTGHVSKGGFQTNTRFSLETAWYDISRQKWQQSHTDDGDQINHLIGQYSNDDQRGPTSGNLNLRFEVTAASGTSGLTMEAGSTAVIVKGPDSDNFRGKSKFYEDTVDDASTWTPVRAYREQPGRGVVNNQVLAFSLLSYTQDNAVEASIQSFDETNVTFGAGSWETPNIWNDQNNALQTRADVENIVDSNGNSVATADNPGGFQIGYSVLAPTTGTKFDKGASEAVLGVKRNLPSGDIAVLLVNTGATGTLGHTTAFEQDW